MNSEATLVVEREGPVVVLTMNRPERKNALTIDMIIRMADAWDMIDGDDEIRCAILTGAGSAYCVGGDMSDGWMAGGGHRDPIIEARMKDDPSVIGKGLLLTRWLRNRTSGTSSAMKPRSLLTRRSNSMFPSRL